MGRYRSIAPVFDSETGRTHMPGSTFDLDDSRAEALVELGAAEPLSSGMTRAQLLEEAAERGIEVPSKATKAEISALLAGED